MTNFLSLPDELLFCWLSYCDNRNLRLINRRIYLVRNNWFKHKVLNLVPLNHSIWNSSYFLFALVSYIKEFDSVRFYSRKLLFSSTLSSYSQNNLSLSSIETMEYICDSWEIIYNLLVRPISIFNYAASTNNFILPMNNFCRNRLNSNRYGLFTIPFNVWICVKDINYVRYINKVVVQLKSYGTNKVDTYFFVSYLHELIKEPGIYCVKIGDISYNFLRSQNVKSNEAESLNLFSPVNVHYYINTENGDICNDKLKVLGYSFDDFNSYYELLYFKVPLEAENFVINKWGTLVGSIFASYLLNNNNLCNTNYPHNKPDALLMNDDDSKHIDNNITFSLECFGNTQRKKHMPNRYIKDLRLPKLIEVWKE